MKLSAADLAKKMREAVLANFSATATDDSLFAAALSVTEGVELEAGVVAKSVITDVLGDLKAEFKGLKKEPEPAMSDALMLGQLIDLKADNKMLLSAMVEKDAKIATLEAAAKDATAPALAFLQEQAVKAQVACGVKDAKTPDTLGACIETIKECSVNLSNLLVPGGVSQGTKIEASVDASMPHLDAYRPKNS